VSDGDDLLFERICHGVQFQYKGFAPDLKMVTDNPEALARYLIRRAQVKGPYELGGRMNIASGALREYEAARLERLRQSAEKEEQGTSTYNHKVLFDQQVQMDQSLCQIHHQRLHRQRTRLILASSMHAQVNTWRPTFPEHSQSQKISIFEIRIVCWSSIVNAIRRCQHGKNSYIMQLRPT
jgi:hypothetical protein